MTTAATSPALDDVLAQLWAGFAALAASRVDVLEAYSAALTAGRDDPDLRRPAALAAHQLAGVLGSYGRPGSDDASALEVVLRDVAAVRDPDTVSAHVAALRRGVTG